MTDLTSDSGDGIGRGFSATLRFTDGRDKVVHVLHLDADTPVPQEYTQTPDWGVPFPVRDFGTGDDYESIINRTPRGFCCDPVMYVDEHCRMRVSSLDGQAQVEFGNEVLGTAHLVFTPGALVKFAPLVAWAARLTRQHGYLPPVPDPEAATGPGSASGRSGADPAVG
jgi:hypothetical protein